MVEKRFQKLFEPSLEIQESNKTNRVQFRLRMTKNQHKQSKLLKLPFQQTEPNEPIDLVSQPVQTVEKIFQKNSEPSLQIQESSTTNGNRFSARMNKNQPKQPNYPNCLFCKPNLNEPTNLVSQPVHTIERGSQNMS